MTPFVSLGPTNGCGLPHVVCDLGGSHLSLFLNNVRVLQVTHAVAEGYSGVGCLVLTFWASKMR